MKFPSQIFFNDINHGYRAAILKKNYLWLLPFYVAMATYCYYEIVRRTMRTAILSYLLKLTILIFWNKFTQKGYLQSKTEKVNTTIEFCIFELV